MGLEAPDPPPTITKSAEQAQLPYFPPDASIRNETRLDRSNIMSTNELLQRAIQGVALKAILAAERVQTGVTFFPMGEAFYADPYTPYRRLREKDPIHRTRLINGWVMTRHADITAILRDPSYSADERNQSGYEKMRAQAIKQGLM